MCGRYYIGDDDADELREIIEILNRRPDADSVKTSGEVFPSDTVPVIASSRSMNRSAFAMSWGYTLSDGKRIINARSESAEEKPMFRDGMRCRRCAVPARNYFEWERRKKDKTKYAIRPVGGELMYMAGIYRIEREKPEFVILTREPAENISFIHDRMPVLLPREMVADWIQPKYAAQDLLKEALTEVQFQKSAADAWEQLGMEL